MKAKIIFPTVALLALGAGAFLYTRPVRQEVFSPLAFNGPGQPKPHREFTKTELADWKVKVERMKAEMKPLGNQKDEWIPPEFPISVPPVPNPAAVEAEGKIPKHSEWIPPAKVVNIPKIPSLREIELRGQKGGPPSVWIKPDRIAKVPDPGPPPAH